MKLNERFDVSEGKQRELRERIERLGVDLSLVEESFARGGGRGGQKVDKTSNAVTMRYPPLEIVVHCHRERRRSINRFLALRELVDRIEARLSPGTSRKDAKIVKLRKRKTRRKQRSRKKYHGAQNPDAQA